MVSRLPVFSGKRVGKRVPPEMVLPVFVVVVLFFALLITYPWWVLTHRHARLSRLPAARLALLSRTTSARMRGRRAATPAAHAGDAPLGHPAAPSERRPAERPPGTPEIDAARHPRP